MRTIEPTPGLAHWFTLQMGEQTMVSLRFFLYGEDAHAAVQRDEPRWGAWINALFP